MYPTLEQGLQHLRRSPAHTTETLALLDLYGNSYTAAAARTLVSFTINTAREHEAAIAEAEHAHLKQAQDRRTSESGVCLTVEVL